MKVQRGLHTLRGALEPVRAHIWLYVQSGPSIFLQYFKNLFNTFINILVTLQDFNGRFSKYFFNITVLLYVGGYIKFQIFFIVKIFLLIEKYKE